MKIITSLKHKLESSKHAIEEAFIAEHSIREERLSVCMSCEHLFKPTSSCKKCGCFVKAKTQLKDAACPIDKW